MEFLSKYANILIKRIPTHIRELGIKVNNN